MHNPDPGLCPLARNLSPQPVPARRHHRDPPCFILEQALAPHPASHRAPPTLYIWRGNPPATQPPRAASKRLARPGSREGSPPVATCRNTKRPRSRLVGELADRTTRQNRQTRCARPTLCLSGETLHARRASPSRDSQLRLSQVPGRVYCGGRGRRLHDLRHVTPEAATLRNIERALNPP